MSQTVIIVDGNLLCARLYKAMLGPLDCRVLVARTAEEAARLVEQDIPQDDADAEASRPLFLVSAPAEAEPLQQIAHSTGGDAVLVRKPVARGGLESIVRRHLGARH